MLSAKQYLLERALRHYVQNVEQVLDRLSITSLLFGSLKLEEVCFVPETVQDILFSYFFFACEVVQATAFNIEVSVDWLSISTKSIVLRIPRIEADVLLHDPNDLASAPLFWDAQALRNKMESEALGVPAESTLLYKVSGGLDIVIDELVLRIRNPGDTETRLRACLLGVRYCPAMPSGSPTHDLDMAIRPNLERCAVAYSYSFEVQSLELALVPVVGEPWAASGDAVVGLCGLRLSSHGSCPASRLHQAPFYMDGVLSVEIGEINATKGAVPVDGLSSLIEVMSRMVLSDNLRAGFDRQPAVKDRKLPGRRGDLVPDADVQPPEAKARAEPRPATAARRSSNFKDRKTSRERDMANLLAGCARTSTRPTPPPPPAPLRGLHDSSQARAKPTGERGRARERCPPTSPAAAGAGALEECSPDADEFKDCEEFDFLELPTQQQDKGPDPDQETITVGGLKRVALSLGSACLVATGLEGDLRVQLEGLHLSTDTRWRPSDQHLACLRSLVAETSLAGGEAAAELRCDAPRASTASEAKVVLDHGTIDVQAEGLLYGVIYAGASLRAAVVSFAPGLGSGVTRPPTPPPPPVIERLDARSESTRAHGLSLLFAQGPQFWLEVGSSSSSSSSSSSCAAP